MPKRRKTRTGCTRKTIKFKTKRGRVISFTGREGPSCGPRKKPSTRHLAPWKAVMKKAAPQCKRAARGNVRAYRKCIGTAVRSVHG